MRGAMDIEYTVPDVMLQEEESAIIGIVNVVTMDVQLNNGFMNLSLSVIQENIHRSHKIVSLLIPRAVKSCMTWP